MADLVISRPILTMPEAEAAELRAHYSVADVILEYGTGGSTVMAAEMEGKTIFAVESDADWLADMQRYFAENPPVSMPNLHHGNIGPTKAWGHPKTENDFRSWPSYALSVWDLPQFKHPDVVLIDGRFRSACFLTALFKVTRPVTILWDDYADRSVYHQVERFVKPTKMVGRLAHFEIKPTSIPSESLSWVISTFLRTL